MYTSVELLDMVKARYRLPSDYAAAKKLGVTKACTSSIRCERSFFDATNCIIIAELLELEPLKVIASVQIERAQRLNDEKMVNLWGTYAA